MRGIPNPAKKRDCGVPCLRFSLSHTHPEYRGKELDFMANILHPDLGAKLQKAMTRS